MRKKGLVLLSIAAAMTVLAACNGGHDGDAEVLDVEDAVVEEAVEEAVEVEEEAEASEEAEAEDSEAEPDVVPVEISEAQPGDIVEFGSYEQDGDESNGMEPIQWEVLDVTDGRAMVISRYVLDAKPFNDKFVSVTWEECQLRAWLNDDFFNTAFNDDEKAKIPEVTLENPTAFTAVVESEKDPNTNDKVFLLSMYDVYDYYGKDWIDESARIRGYGYCEDLITSATKAAQKSGVYFIADGGARWWLRSEDSGLAALYVDEEGKLGWSLDAAESVNYEDNGVRPVIYIEF